ncbi:hypothetical protein VYE96_12420 [Fusobacterium pseudoperiodonticum]|nr:hypothetical protein [Fusobacterium pseudoperiodonticum]
MSVYCREILSTFISLVTSCDLLSSLLIFGLTILPSTITVPAPIVALFICSLSVAP